MAENLPQDKSNDRRAQVQVIPFMLGDTPEHARVLLFKRNPEKGGFWQPITGGVNHDEDVEPAALREAQEEAGITPADIVGVVNDGYQFEFTDTHHGVVKTFTEHVLALVMRQGFEPRLSEEHTEARWADYNEAIGLLKYESNKNSLRHYREVINGMRDNGHDGAQS